MEAVPMKHIGRYREDWRVVFGAYVSIAAALLVLMFAPYGIKATLLLLIGLLCLTGYGQSHS